MKTKTAVDDALARLSRAIDRPWDNGSLPSYEDTPSPVTRFVNRWTKPAPTSVPTGFTGTLPLTTSTTPAHPSTTTSPDALHGRIAAPASRSDAPAYPTDDPDMPPPRRRGSPRDFEPVEPPDGDYLFLAEGVGPARRPDASRPTHTIDGAGKPGRAHDGKHQYEPHDSGDDLSEPDQFDPATPARRRLFPRVPRLAAILAVLVGALLAGYLALPSAPDTPDAPGAAAEPPAPIPLAAEQPARTVTIDVQGKVRKPGLQHLPDGSRVHDAIKSSGGALPGTDTSTLNLARRLTDGEQINVGAPPAAADPAMQQPLTNLNTAPVYQLDALPGVGIVTAQRIVEYRNRQRFTDVDQLRQIEGIGPTRFNRLKDLVTVN